MGKIYILISKDLYRELLSYIEILSDFRKDTSHKYQSKLNISKLNFGSSVNMRLLRDHLTKLTETLQQVWIDYHTK